VCALALLVGTDRFRMARSVGWWGVVAGGVPLLLGRALPTALGLAHGHGTLSSGIRTELAATEPLVGLSLVLCLGGAVLVAVGSAGPYAVRWVLHGTVRAAAVPPPAAAAEGGIGVPPRPGVAAGTRRAWPSAGVDVRL
jgi:hypothetical protein